MKLIIDIPEDLYKENIRGTVSDRQCEKILKCVKNGTPLPKGHGDLIDRRGLIKSGVSKYAKPIIEADKESEE